MSPSTWHRIKDLYNEATALPPDQRQPFLDSIQAVQPREAAEVIRLLRLDSRAGQKFEPVHAPRRHPGFHDPWPHLLPRPASRQSL